MKVLVPIRCYRILIKGLMITRRAFLRVSLCFPPALLLTTACSGSRSAVSAQLDHGTPAALGGTMTFWLTASCVLDAPNPDSDGTKTTAAEVAFSMTNGLAPLDSQWEANPIREGMTSYRRSVVFKADVPQSFELAVRLEQEGDQQIIGEVEVVLLDSTDSDSQTLFLRVSALDTLVQRDPFTPTR